MRRVGRSAGLIAALSCLPALCAAAAPPVQAVPAGVTAWHVTASPNRTGANELDAVSCSGQGFCAAVGDSQLGGRGTLVEMWDGHQWSITPSPSPGPLPDRGSLVGVSCPSPRFCAAVGYYSAVSLRDLTLIEIWNGQRWSVSPSPDPSDYSHLLGVSCPNARNCEAVGMYEHDCSAHVGGSSGFAERWDGSDWTVVPSPRRPCGDTQLQAVSCPAAARCTAVGHYGHGPQEWTLVESWDGAQWSIVPSPNRNPGNNNVLQGVSCPGGQYCVAVGWYQAAFAGPAVTLAETWNGTTWSLAASPPAAAEDPLASVACTGPADCVAVGDLWYSQADAKTLVEEWDGSAWSLTSSPNPRPVQELDGVACTSWPGCVAVGYRGTTTGLPARTLVETGN